MQPFFRIMPTDEVPLPNPPTSGNWVRHLDGSISPADESTAQSAWPAAESPVAGAPELPESVE